MKRGLVSFLSVLLLIVLGGVSGAVAQSDFGPKIPKAVGAPHPEGNEFWRINHMVLLRHDRDQTVHFGDREVRASLKECVACHAVSDEQGEPVGIDNAQHICRTCHDFAAVKIDCFSCHESKPDPDILTRLLNESATNVSMIDITGGLQNYITTSRLQVLEADEVGEISQ